MLKSLKRRFDDIEDSKLLLIAICLDPRFKDKFSPVRLKGWPGNVSLWIQMMKLEPQNKTPRTETSDDSLIDAVSTIKVWKCFTEILHDCGATIDTEGGIQWIDIFLNRRLTTKKVIHTRGGITTS